MNTIEQQFNFSRTEYTIYKMTQAGIPDNTIAAFLHMTPMQYARMRQSVYAKRRLTLENTKKTKRAENDDGKSSD